MEVSSGQTRGQSLKAVACLQVVGEVGVDIIPLEGQAGTRQKTLLVNSISQLYLYRPPNCYRYITGAWKVY